MDLSGSRRQRARKLSRKIASSPVLPVLGITKAVETVIAGGPTLRWLAYALLVTIVWIYADDLQRRAFITGDTPSNRSEKRSSRPGRRSPGPMTPPGRGLPAVVPTPASRPAATRTPPLTVAAHL